MHPSLVEDARLLDCLVGIDEFIGKTELRAELKTSWLLRKE
jgi:hypothetical protein